jgi:hypothetical protein
LEQLRTLNRLVGHIFFKGEPLELVEVGFRASGRVRIEACASEGFDVFVSEPGLDEGGLFALGILEELVFKESEKARAVVEYPLILNLDIESHRSEDFEAEVLKAFLHLKVIRILMNILFLGVFNLLLKERLKELNEAKGCFVIRAFLFVSVFIVPAPHHRIRFPRAL